MKTRHLTKATALAIVFLAMSSCNFLNPGPLPEALMGQNAGELKAKVCELMDMAGTDSTQVEFAEINTYFLYRPNDNLASAYIQIVSPEDKNKMMEYTWTDMNGRRNMKEANELVVSTRLDNDVIDTYDGFKEMLFTYDDIRVYLDNLPTYCKEAIEASGYKNKAFISSFNIEKDKSTITVNYKEDTSLSKTYEIDPEGKHIVIPE